MAFRVDKEVILCTLALQLSQIRGTSPSNVESRERSPEWKQWLRTEDGRETSRSRDQNSNGTQAEMELGKETGMRGTE